MLACFVKGIRTGLTVVTEGEEGGGSSSDATVFGVSEHFLE